MPVWSEVLPYLYGAGIVALVLVLACRFLHVRANRSFAVGAGVWALVALALCFFFRDPERTPPEDRQLVVSGADGVVHSVQKMQDELFPDVEVVRITVFLNLHNVHVNRSPIKGIVKSVEFREGKALVAYREEASHLNQANTIVIEGSGTRCVVRQLIGAVVRRVVSWVEPGDALERGQRFGMMKFGSRLDVFLPSEDIEILVAVGDRVLAGETPIARLLRSD